jgi:hypothetical protein
MIEVTITPEMVEKAKKKAEDLGELRNSITEGQGNLAGFIGEYVAAHIMGGEVKNTRDYDMVMPDETKIDVKTKRCTSPPKPHYDMSVADFNTSQRCDKYVFVRVMKNLSKAWVLGEMDKDEFYQTARFVEEGQYDPSNDWRCKADCWSVLISQLHEVVQTV